MKVKELVSGLKKLTGCYPVVLMRGEETLGLSREFQNDGSDWAQLSLVVRKPMELDTEFLKVVLDYCARQEHHSLFSDETPFEEFEVLASQEESKGAFYTIKILKCGIEKVNDVEVFALHVEEIFDIDKVNN